MFVTSLGVPLLDDKLASLIILDIKIIFTIPLPKLLHSFHSFLPFLPACKNKRENFSPPNLPSPPPTTTNSSRLRNPFFLSHFGDAFGGERKSFACFRKQPRKEERSGNNFQFAAQLSSVMFPIYTQKYIKNLSLV